MNGNIDHKINFKAIPGTGKTASVGQTAFESLYLATAGMEFLKLLELPFEEKPGGNQEKQKKETLLLRLTATAHCILPD